jgi:tyrosinase
MALRRIIGITRGSRGTIVAVCAQDVDAVLPVGSVVEDIQAGRHSYFVNAGGHPTRVFTVRDRISGREYLRTGPDRDTANNLDFLPACETPPRLLTSPTRRDVATVADDERTRLRDAIVELNQRYLAPGDRVSVWFKQDEIHQATHVHNQPSFLPWHRVLVNNFERQLQEIDPTLALHYWDWTTDPRRAPDGRGGTVNLMTESFMGASEGSLGPPFLEAGFYRPTPPNRDEPSGVPGARPDPALPPADVARHVLPSGRGPREVTVDDIAQLYSGDPVATRPTREEQIRIRADEDLLRRGLDPRPGVQYERMWKALYYDHGLAHRYIGGTVGGFGSGADVAHRSFEDPFVFLLHSNVDRLWASWQLNQRGFNAWEEPAWRIEPDWAYGELIDDRVEELSEPLLRGDSETVAAFRERYEKELTFQGEQAGREIKSLMRPWGAHASGGTIIEPWGALGAADLIRPIDREVLRPPPYDRYAFDGNLCSAWVTLQLGRRLSTHDVVRLTVELDAVPRSEVEFVLRSGPDVLWWKGLRLPDWTMIETTGPSGRASAVHAADQLTGGELIFHKLQGFFFPGRRIVFRIADLGWIRPGSRLTFLWEDD